MNHVATVEYEEDRFLVCQKPSHTNVPIWSQFAEFATSENKFWSAKNYWRDPFGVKGWFKIGYPHGFHDQHVPLPLNWVIIPFQERR